MTLAAVAALAASPAFAATIIQDHVIAAADAPVSTVFGFTQFDPGLGTLNSVTLALNADLSSSGTLANTSNATKVFTLTENAAAGLTGGGFNLDAPLLTGSGQYTVLGKSANAPASIALSGDGADSGALSSGLAAFIGNGAVDFTFTRAADFDLNPNSGTLDLASSIWGDATLTYNYTAATPKVGPVPEPASWAMLILGFASLGGVLRHRRQRGSAAVAA
jgi:hypothetical protein